MKTIKKQLLICVALAALLAGCREEVSGEAAKQPVDPARAATVTIAIEGMHCDGCAGTIQKGLAAMEGVDSCTVSFENKLAVVTYDKEQLSPEAVAAAIREIDPAYSAAVRDPAAAEVDESDTPPATQ